MIAAKGDAMKAKDTCKLTVQKSAMIVAKDDAMKAKEHM